MLGLKALSKNYVEQSRAPSPTAGGDSKLENPPGIDFSADPEIVRVIAEGERLTYGYLINPSFLSKKVLRIHTFVLLPFADLPNEANAPSHTADAAPYLLSRYTTVVPICKIRALARELLLDE
jgi:hypothetical protein